MADELAKKHGYSGYKVVSLVEMDFATDEQQFIDQVLFNDKKEGKKISSRAWSVVALLS